MKVTVKRVDLLSKLKERLTKFTSEFEEKLSLREDYERKVTADAKRAAKALLNSGDYKTSVSCYENHPAVTVTIEVKSEIPFVPVPSRPYKYDSELELLAKAISTLELSIDEELVITEKDNYFRYLL